MGCLFVEGLRLLSVRHSIAKSCLGTSRAGPLDCAKRSHAQHIVSIGIIFWHSNALWFLLTLLCALLICFDVISFHLAKESVSILLAIRRTVGISYLLPVLSGDPWSRRHPGWTSVCSNSFLLVTPWYNSTVPESSGFGKPWIWPALYQRVKEMLTSSKAAKWFPFGSCTGPSSSTKTDYFHYVLVLNKCMQWWKGEMLRRVGSALQMTGLFGLAIPSKCSRYKSSTLQSIWFVQLNLMLGCLDL